MEKPKHRMGSGSTQLPYGSAKELNDSLKGIDMQLQSVDQMVTQGDYSPANADPEVDELMFRPTDRPQEPVTQGAPVGPGSNFVVARDPNEVESSFRKRLSELLISSSDSSDSEKMLAYRIAQGE